MGNWKKWKIAKIAMAALAVVSLTATVAASTAGAQEEPATADQPALDHQSSYFTLAPSSERSAPVQDSGRESSVTAAWIFSSCLHNGETDDLHYSNSHSGNQQISVHGWWNALNDHCPEKADVWVKLQAWHCTYWHVFRICDWKDLNRSRTKRIRQGGGSSKWVNARYTCVASSREITWRAVVDVDIPGQIDGSEKYYSEEYDFYCDPVV